MTYIDQMFYHLIEEIKEKEEKELLEDMKITYLSLPISLRNNIEEFLNHYGYWGKLDWKASVYEEIEKKASSLKQHVEDYVFLYEHLMDYRSKKLLFGILNNWFHYDMETLKTLMDNPFPHYFDLDIITPHKEVFVDVGAYIGDTTLDFIHLKEDSYDKIYCYEATPSTFSILKKKVEKYPNVIPILKAVGDKKQMVSLKEDEEASANQIQEETGNIQMTTLDEDIQEKITYLKMDIEGFEEKAIKGAVQHIKNDHPTLFLSVYHNHDDLWKIPKMIYALEPNYQFYLRFYGNSIFPTEIVFLAK